MDQACGIARAGLARVDDLLRDHAARGEVAGAVGLIARGDEVHVATAGVQDLASAVPMRRDTIFRIASMTRLARSPSRPASDVLPLLRRGRDSGTAPVPALLRGLVHQS